MEFTIEYEQEEDGRWLAEVLDLPGVLTYGDTVESAIMRIKTFTLQIIAEQLELCEIYPLA